MSSSRSEAVCVNTQCSIASVIVAGSVAAYFDKYPTLFCHGHACFPAKASARHIKCSWEGHLVIPALQFNAVIK